MKILTLLLALLVLAAPAGASTVRVTKSVEFDSDDDFGRDDTETTTAIYRFRAMPGEQNRVRIRRKTGGRIVFIDRGARLQAGKRCTSKGMHRAACRIDFFADARFLSVRLGDRSDSAFAGRSVALDASWYGRAGNDRIRGSGGADYATGGAGDDTIRGKDGRDNLLGRAGADRLTGGGKADTLVDGSGRDVVLAGPGSDTVYSRDGAAPGSDRLGGGPDVDIVSYSSRSAAVAVTLNGAGEDRLRGFEDLTGGDGDDTLTGDDAANLIDGGSGADTMDGRGGDDLFEVSSSFENPEREADHTFCGDGSDRIRYTFGGDYLVEPDCERTTPANVGAILANPLATTADTVTVRVQCARADATPAQRLIELRIPAFQSAWYSGGGLGSVVGTGEVPVGEPAARCDTPVTLNDAGRALVRPIPLRLAVGESTGWHFQLR